MSRPMIRIHDSEKDQIIDREMSVAEFKIYEATDEANLLKEAKAEAKAAQRQAILNKLGLTADEAQLLIL